ncbi:DUF3095 domain-containing protein [Roseobacter denitrificans]|uniref:Adenylate cyclase n=1 Tax=Roseobacter denitrificans (strain ATCC 33942 / OCh 114) TaxID=375451 RepID=Q16DB4_ROSDO|nr:DUF3095 domain-containing protein [Roseobacter denitrificans]ABG30029.1 conserved hypothetical protein [Roseobacter denitrificans OCh 114]AVL54907.1 DUF3095 domain-containing protein [Roseobacter denitrificans]SFF68879.1 Protein of unknown function [Roseobacter denitrificans OCh 114]
MKSFHQPDDFYDSVPRETSFDHLTDLGRYTPLPDDWQIGVADIVNSTGEVAAGRYKTVNMVGAAVISAVMNGLNGRPFPFVFGGDGAGFAVGPDAEPAAREALAAISVWARAEFAIGMRVALVPVADARAAGHDVKVARFQASPGADYAMFSGGGLLWAETEMKRRRYVVAPAAEGTIPDLTGLSCRWAHMKARNGTILSLVVAPIPDADAADVAQVYKRVIDVAGQLDRGGHPAPQVGMVSRWPPAGATLEAHAARGSGSLGAARRKALLESLLAWVLIRTGLKIGGFDARRYARVVADNADFRKLDDGLKTTLDCDAETQSRLTAVLAQGADQGIVRFGMATQEEAMMTCIVPSILTDDHLHFIDGAAGGYTQAAAQMKTR